MLTVLRDLYLGWTYLRTPYAQAKKQPHECMNRFWKGRQLVTAPQSLRCMCVHPWVLRKWARQKRWHELVKPHNKCVHPPKRTRARSVVSCCIFFRITPAGTSFLIWQHIASLPMYYMFHFPDVLHIPYCMSSGPHACMLHTMGWLETDVHIRNSSLALSFLLSKSQLYILFKNLKVI